MQVMELIPENWSFVMGRQNTVRRGFKWADLVPNESIRFECKDGRIQSAIVKRVTKAEFRDLTDEECSENHAYNGRDDLFAALERAYGVFDMYAPVTLIEFYIDFMDSVQPEHKQTGD